MALVALPTAQILTPLRFGTATSDRVEVPSSALHESLTQNTVLMIVRPTTLTSGRRLYQKEVGLTDWAAELSGTGGNIDCYHGFASGFTQRVTSDTPLARLGRWVQLAVSLRAANDMSVYHGPLGAALKESTYGSQTNTAVGSPLSASNVFIWANRNTNNIAFQGDIAFGAIVSRGLSITEVNEFFASGNLPRGTRFASVLGANGRGRTIDYSGSGLHGTITGAIPRESVVVPWRSNKRMYIPTAGGGGGGFQAAWARHSNVLLMPARAA